MDVRDIAEYLIWRARYITRNGKYIDLREIYTDQKLQDWVKHPFHIGVRYSDSTSYYKKYSSSKCKQTVCLHYRLDFHFKNLCIEDAFRSAEIYFAFYYITCREFLLRTTKANVVFEYNQLQCCYQFRVCYISTMHLRYPSPNRKDVLKLFRHGKMQLKYFYFE